MTEEVRRGREARDAAQVRGHSWLHFYADRRNRLTTPAEWLTWWEIPLVGYDVQLVLQEDEETRRR